MRTLFAAAFLAAATPAFADTAAGTVFTYDAKSMTLVMEDNTVWQLEPTTVLPETLETGDKIVIDFTSDGDNGVVSVDAITSQAEQGA